MLRLLDKLLLLVFSKLPLVRLLDGRKRAIADFLIVLAAALAALQELRPEFTWVASVSAIVGFCIKLIGVSHAAAKDRAEPKE